MLRMSKLTDYATVILAHLARAGGELNTAADVAARTGLAVPTVSKLLKVLTRAGLVTSVRGAQGGYHLARPPKEISAADVIDALEGPVAITACSSSDVQCGLESVCQVGSAWQRINTAIRLALRDVSLAQLIGAPGTPRPRFDLAGAAAERAPATRSANR
jgi:FeS assembly SUF system regulator